MRTNDEELAGIASDVRHVVDGGKGRSLGLDVVRAAIEIFAACSCSTWLQEMLWRLAIWTLRSIEIGDGIAHEHEPHTLLCVSGLADRLASAALCQARAGAPVQFERWIVHDIATALRRACECSAWPSNIVQLAGMVASERGATKNEQEDADRMQNGHEHTATTLLPLLLRDMRRLCAAAHLRGDEIEAVVARFGGRPS